VAQRHALLLLGGAVVRVLPEYRSLGAAKHAELLALAGVDVVIFDCTNGNYTWKESYMALCDVFMKARNDGVKAPHIAFMLALVLRREVSRRSRRFMKICIAGEVQRPFLHVEGEAANHGLPR